MCKIKEIEQSIKNQMVADAEDANQKLTEMSMKLVGLKRALYVAEYNLALVKAKEEIKEIEISGNGNLLNLGKSLADRERHFIMSRHSNKAYLEGLKRWDDLKMEHMRTSIEEASLKNLVAIQIAALKIHE